MIQVVEIEVPIALRAIPELVRAVAYEVAENARNDIIAMANRELKTSARDYVHAVHLLTLPLSSAALKRGPADVATIVLIGWLPNAVEHGYSAFDMKEGLLNGRNAKRTKDGKRYAFIPFRHGTPDSSGRHFAPMGEIETKHGGLSAEDARRLGKAVYERAQKLSATTSHPKTGTEWGERLEAGVGGAVPLKNQNSGYQHKSDIYAGMVRKEKTYAVATQNQYMTFRAVSDNSDPLSWQHPGFEKHDFFGRAQVRIPGIADMMFANAIRGMTAPGGGTSS